MSIAAGSGDSVTLIIYFSAVAAVCQHMFACGYQNMSVGVRGCV